MQQKYEISLEAKEAILKGLLKCEAFIFGDIPFKTAGGLKIPYYVNWKRLASDPETLKIIAREFAKIAEIADCNYIGGLETGGIAFAAATSLESGKPFFYLRKEKQNHGAGEYLVGRPPKKGAKIILIDDSAGSGGSLKTFKKNLEKEGYEVNTFAYVVEADIARQNTKRFAEWDSEKIAHYFLVSYDELIEFLIKNKLISSDFVKFNYLILDKPLEYEKEEVLNGFFKLKRENKIWVKQGDEIN